MLRITLVAWLAVLLAHCAPKQIVVERPEAAAPPPAPLELEDSIIQIPITLPLEPIKAQVEAVLPRVLLEREKTWEYLGAGLGYAKYRVWRDDISATLFGNLLRLRIRIHFRAEYARASRYGALSLGKCGYTDAPGSFEVELTSPVSLSESWSIVVDPASKVTQGGACKMTMFGINITPRVQPMVDKHLQTATQQLVQRLKDHTALRDLAMRAWTELHAPIAVEQGSFVINPSKLQVSPVNGTGDTINVTLGLIARPVLRLGERPTGTIVAPLPPPERITPGNSFHLALEATMRFSMLGEMVAAALRKEPPAFGDHRLYVDSVQVYPRHPQLVVALHTIRPIEGTIFLVGTPHYDANNALLTVPNLAFEAKTQKLLQRMAVWVMQDKIVNYLREKSSWSLKDQIGEVRKMANAALNRDLPIARLSGKVTALRGIGTVLHPDALGVRLVLDGFASAAVR